jgi:hypothetical protein
MDRDSVVMPYPVGGWEKFDSLIVYPEIYKRARVEGLYIITLEVDTSGVATVMKVEPPPGVVAPATISKLEEIKWIPATKGGEKIDYVISIPVLYLLEKEDRAPLQIKKGNPVIPQNHVTK